MKRRMRIDPERITPQALAVAITVGVALGLVALFGSSLSNDPWWKRVFVATIAALSVTVLALFALRILAWARLERSRYKSPALIRRRALVWCGIVLLGFHMYLALTCLFVSTGQVLPVVVPALLAIQFGCFSIPALRTFRRAHRLVARARARPGRRRAHQSSAPTR